VSRHANQGNAQRRSALPFFDHGASRKIFHWCLLTKRWSQ
jgi:hypothetical protein